MLDTWSELLLDQLTFHWDSHLRPKLGTLTDDEYFWEPVAGCWSVRPRSEATSPMATGGGDLVVDWAWPEPDPAPVTTIAWRLAHLIVGVIGRRNAMHFGGPEAEYQSWQYAPTAQRALQQLDDAYDSWIAGVKGLDDAALREPVGAREEGWEIYPYAALVLHITREVVHHGAEILVLRDLYRSRAA